MITLLIILFSMSCVMTQIIQMEPSQGILIPAEIAQSVRITRSSQSPSTPPTEYSSVSTYPYSKLALATTHSYKPSSIPTLPCPRNYLFSCQASLIPTQCSSPVPSPSYTVPAKASTSSSYVTPQGAYSHIIPQYSFAVPVVKELF
uniref:Vitelline membrane protein Vm26Ab n=1 Tax=Bactrocera dorsalis TaxID=27457 RepID=A0A2R3VH51_BACDO|nr:vitelline membrane protein Vm26Ab [Bactrocera dorsalis]